MKKYFIHYLKQYFVFISSDFNYAELLLLDVTLKESEDIQIPFNVSADPTPEFLISKINGVVLSNININRLSINVSQAVRSNTGRYNVTVSNSAGSSTIYLVQYNHYYK